MNPQEARRQNESAIIIQAFFRGCQTRAIQRELLRQEFEFIQSKNPQNVTIQLLTKLMNHLRFFFDKDKDSGKLIWLSQLIIKNSVQLMKESEVEPLLVFCIAHFLNLTLHYISNTIASTEIKGSHWRILEIFLNTQGWRQNVGIQTADNILGFIFGILSKKGMLHS